MDTCVTGKLGAAPKRLDSADRLIAIQRHKDPTTGEETIVFSCFNQDQALDRVDFTALR